MTNIDEIAAVILAVKDGWGDQIMSENEARQIAAAVIAHLNK